jgi:hypothetical protein
LHFYRLPPPDSIEVQIARYIRIGEDVASFRQNLLCVISAADVVKNEMLHA